MGSMYPRNQWEQAAVTRAANKARREIEREEDEARMKLADKIAMMVSTRIEADLIRPGPVAEERECYDMADELRQMRPNLARVVADILKAEGIIPDDEGEQP